MSPQEILKFSFESCNPCFRSGIKVEPQESYEISGRIIHKLKDWFVNTGLDGFNNPINWFLKNRVKNKKCFLLMGSVGQGDLEIFPIGSQIVVHQCGYTEELCFFVNDVKSKAAYSNNKGVIEITVKRIS
jgi:predicted component of viral defense system (DUF524 family)